MGNRLVARQREWLCPDGLANPARTDALGADTDGLDFAAWQRRFDGLKIRKESSSGNSGDFGTHTPQILGLTSRLDHIANLRRLIANFTCSCHD